MWKRIVSVALISASLAAPAQAGWSSEVKTDPFNGAKTASMTAFPEGWGMLIILGCEKHGYLAITVALPTHAGRGWASEGAVKTQLQVRVDSGFVHHLSAGLYPTIGNRYALRTTQDEVPEVWNIAKELVYAKHRLAIKWAGLEGFTAASSRGSTEGARRVMSVCKQEDRFRTTGMRQAPAEPPFPKSEKVIVSHLKLDMSLDEVLSILGRPDFVVPGSDGGEWAPYPDQLSLYWRNCQRRSNFASAGRSNNPSVLNA